MKNSILTYESKKLLEFYKKFAQKNVTINNLYKSYLLNNSNSNSNKKNVSKKELYYYFHEFLFESYNKYKKSLIAFNNIHNYRIVYISNNSYYKDYLTHLVNDHLINNRFVSNNIKKFINNKKLLNCYLIVYNIDPSYFDLENNINNSINTNTNNSNTNYKINFFIYNKINEKQLQLLDKQVFNIIIIINIIRNLTNYKCSNNGLNINIFKTPFKRYIQDINKNTKNTKNTKKNKQILGSQNANGGFCYGCTNKGTIIVYRNEEYLKVLIHELLHNYGVDENIFYFIKNKCANSLNAQLYDSFISNFNLNKNQKTTDIGLQECLIEFWGQFIHKSLYSLNINNNFSLYIKLFEKLQTIENYHNLFQVTKILNYNAMSYSKLINNSQKTTNNYNEFTYIFSYYILRTFLNIDYKSFVNSEISLYNNKNIKTKNNNNLTLRFENNNNNFEKFFNYIIKQAKHQNIISIFALIEKTFAEFFTKNRKKMTRKRQRKNPAKTKNTKPRKIKNLLFNNLRMSFLDYL
jgi:hypothetical protein